MTRCRAPIGRLTHLQLEVLLLAELLAAAQLAVQQLVLALLVLPAGCVAPVIVTFQDQNKDLGTFWVI